MKRLLLLLALAAMPLAAQDQKEELKRPQAQKLFVLKYADPNQVGNLLRVFTTNVTPNSAMHALAVSATPEAMVAIEDAIKRLDVPSAAPQNIELTAYMLVGSETGPPTGTPIPPIPKDLDSVVTQLKNAFPYKEYRLMDILTLRTRTGQRAETSSTGSSVKIGGISQPVVTQFRIESATAAPDGTVRINGLRLGNRVPYATGSFQPGVGGVGVNPLVNTQFQYQDIGLSTDVDIKEGQKLVVGKMGMNTNEAIFLVLVARVAQ